MSRFELTRFPNGQLLAQSIAAQWLDLVETSSNNGVRFCVALSGGRIARQLFCSTAAIAKARSLLNGDVHFFWGDERCVTPEDPESNFRAAKELLFDPLAISSTRIHRVNGELTPPIQAAIDAEEQLCSFCPKRLSGFPLIDLIFLGMGEDGHVASLFPEETEEARANSAIYRAVVGTKPPPNRITLGYNVIAAGREVWVLASGPGKTHVLRASLREDGVTPLARVLKMRACTRILTDIDSFT
jgi:6-phosphogluconolactonase